MKDYQKIRELLEQERYPHHYTHKFIGAKTAQFVSAVSALEKKFKKSKKTSERESAGAGGTVYLAVTFVLVADSADEIIALLKETASLPDLKIIL